MTSGSSRADPAKELAAKIVGEMWDTCEHFKGGYIRAGRPPALAKEAIAWYAADWLALKKDVEAKSAYEAIVRFGTVYTNNGKRQPFAPGQVLGVDEFVDTISAALQLDGWDGDWYIKSGPTMPAA